MILVVGGEGSGKREYVHSLGYTWEEMTGGVQDDCPVLYHLERIIFARPESASELLPSLTEKEVVICNEVGSGIIPIDTRERLSREATGRICTLLAKEAETVVRMVCGIPTAIKGILPSGRVSKSC